MFLTYFTIIFDTMGIEHFTGLVELIEKKFQMFPFIFFLCWEVLEYYI